jgi:hypothetical protein
MKKKIFGAVALALVTLTVAQTRPRTPFVFRAAINEAGGDRPSNNKNRLVAVLLNTNFTALYSTLDGGLYMTRSGTANDINRSYSQVVFGQVLAFTGGKVLHRNTSNQMWEFLNNSTAASSKTTYKGFTLKGNVVTLRYAITSGTTTVNIAETPEYEATGSGGIKRSIVVSGLATGQSVRLKLNGGVATETWTAASGGTISGTNPMYLTVTANGTVSLTGSWN